MERTTSSSFLRQRRISLPMRDGVRLAAQVYQPVEGAVATVLVRTPYGLDTLGVGIAGNGHHVPHPSVFIDANLAVVWVESRGTFGSEGEFHPQIDELRDGYDTIEWIIQQPWSNGVVGMYGASYHGMTQWAAAASGHPALRALVPTVGTMHWYDGLWYHPGGALSLSLVTTWHLLTGINDDLRRSDSGQDAVEGMKALGAALIDPYSFNSPTPIAAHPLLASRASYAEILAHPDEDEFWSARDFRGAVDAMIQPALFIAGWFDLFLRPQIADFELYKRAAGSRSAREGSRLVIGPWDHDPGLAGRYPHRDFGLAASPMAADLSGEHVRHLTHWLGEGSDATAAGPAVKLFLMGRDEWMEFDSWPPADSAPTPFFLDAREGTLATDAPREAGRGRYEYDPATPVPTRGGAVYPPVWGVAGPIDQRDIDDRVDILRFTSDPVTSDVTVIGNVSAVLHVRSSAVDTDFTVKLVDVYPDGRALAVCDGILRMRYREGTDRRSLITPGTIYEVNIEMDPTGIVFTAGHRIRVDVSSSNFPRFDRNFNTGGETSSERLEDAIVACNELLTGPEHASRVMLPILGGLPLV